MASRLAGVTTLVVMTAACGALETRVNPVNIAGGGTSIVTAKFSSDESLAGRAVGFAVVDGEECGTLDAAEAPMDATGRATVNFRGAAGVEACVAEIRATFGDASSDTTVTVAAAPARAVRIDGVSAIAAVLIASFAIDRIVRGLLFLLSFWRRWSRVFHEADDPEGTHAGRKNHQLAYFTLAALLGLVALAGYGGVRILAALGFAGVDPALDTIVTGLLLVGGAERTGALLKGLGGGDAAASAAAPPPPIEITGTLVLDDGARRGEARLGSRDVAGV